MSGRIWLALSVIEILRVIIIDCIENIIFKGTSLKVVSEDICATVDNKVIDARDKMNNTKVLYFNTEWLICIIV